MKVSSYVSLNISSLIICFVILALYVELCTRHYFSHGSTIPLGEGFLKIPNHQSILECSYEYLLIMVDDLHCHLV